MNKATQGQAVNTAYYCIHIMWRQAPNLYTTKYKFPSTAQNVAGKLLENLLGEDTCTSTPKAAVLTSAKPYNTITEIPFKGFRARYSKPLYETNQAIVVYLSFSNTKLKENAPLSLQTDSC